MRFYRLQTNHDMTPELCFEFCIGAGLDLFGLVGEECRCGASLLNKDVWQMAAPRTTGLLLPLAKQLPDTEMQCLFVSTGGLVLSFQGALCPSTCKCCTTAQICSDSSFEILSLFWHIQDISRWDSKFGKSRKPFRATAI